MSQLLPPQWSAGATNLNGAVPPLYTPGRIHITIDAATGDDDADFFVANETLLAPDGVTLINYGDTYFATLATLDGALDRLPSILRHPVQIDLPAGVAPLTVASASQFYPVRFDRFLADQDVRIVDLLNFYLDNFPGIYLRGTVVETLAPTVATIFTATTVGSGALAMVVDTHRGGIVEITAGTGIGQWRRILRNTATTIVIADPWGVVPDGTSSFRAWQPGSSIIAPLGGIIVAENVNGNGVPVSFSPELTINSNIGGICNVFGGQLQTGATHLGSGSLRQMNVFQHSTCFALFFDLVADPFFERQVGAYFRAGQVAIASHSELIATQGTVWDLSFVTVSENSHADLRHDAQGVGLAAAFITIDGSTGNLQKCVASESRIETYDEGIRVVRGGSVFVSASGLDVSLSVGIGIRVAQGASLDAATLGVAITSAFGANGTFGAVVRGQAVFAFGATVPTITGASGDLRLGNATSGATLTWAAVPVADSISDLADLAVVRNVAL